MNNERCVEPLRSGDECWLKLPCPIHAAEVEQRELERMLYRIIEAGWSIVPVTDGLFAVRKPNGSDLPGENNLRQFRDAIRVAHAEAFNTTIQYQTAYHWTGDGWERITRDER